MENCTETMELNSTEENNRMSWKSDYSVKCEFIFDVIAIVLFCFVGLLGNSVTIAVLRRDRDPKRQRTTNWLLTMLAVIDSICLACIFIVFPIRILVKSYATNNVHIDVYIMYTYILLICARIARTMSTWIVVLVTIDRYLAICKPFDTKWRNLRRIKIAVAVMFILEVIHRIPELLEAEFEIYSRYCMKKASLHECREWLCFYYIYEVAIPIIFQYVGPFVTVLVLNVRICMEIKELNKRRNEMTRTVSEENTLTVMVVIVVSVFVICQLPKLVLIFLIPTSVFSYEYGHYICYFVIANALLVLNSSINFLLYCLLWGKFKRILIRMMTCRGENASSEDQNN